MTCKGICIRHKAQKPVGSGRYASGQKRCQICEIFIKWDGLWCPCCGYRLRTKPRNLKYKAKLRARETIKVAQKHRMLYSYQTLELPENNTSKISE
jgi:predicted amidophosphoribosyltransferase